MLTAAHQETACILVLSNVEAFCCALKPAHPHAASFLPSLCT